MNFNSIRWWIRAQRSHFREGIDIVFRMAGPTRGDPDYVMEFSRRELKEEDIGKVYRESEILHLPDNVAQMLMDELWVCGLRPTEGTGSAGSLKATQDHLSDMQKLSWRLLDMVNSALEAGEEK